MFIRLVMKTKNFKKCVYYFVFWQLNIECGIVFVRKRWILMNNRLQMHSDFFSRDKFVEFSPVCSCYAESGWTQQWELNQPSSCETSESSRLRWYFSFRSDTDHTRVLPVALFNVAAQNDCRTAQAKPQWGIKRTEPFSAHQLPPALHHHGAFALEEERKCGILLP